MKTIEAMMKGLKGHKGLKGRKGRQGLSLPSLLSLSSLVLLLPVAARAAHVSETMTLAKGWNAIYLESTPTNSLCADFFAGAPVERVAVYNSDAYSTTRQIADDGTPIDQKPVSYRVWLPSDEDASTLAALAGGRVYMIFASEAWSKTFIGVPAAPRQTWRATSGETGLMNIVGVSAAPDVSVPVKTYFGEGPFGTSSGISYQVGGTKTTAPTFLPMGIAGAPKVSGGKAYALTAAKDAEWPGVIGVQDDGVYFVSDANYATIRVRNCGTTNHTFRFTMVRSDDWEAAGETLPPIMRRLPRTDAISAAAYTNVEENVSWTVSPGPDEIVEQNFCLDRAALETGKKYGAILVIEEPETSKMRVRLPIVAETTPEGTVAYPTGLWIGEIALTQVSRLDDTNRIPVTAGGTLKMNVMMHVDANGAVKLLQRVVAGVDTNGTARLFGDLENVPAEVESPKRISTVMMSVDTPAVEAAGEGFTTFGDALQFGWTIAPTARDNPFRHAWHPDHDGKKADYSGAAPSGDDFENYAQPIKPELWSIVNKIEFSWHEEGNPTRPAHFGYTPDETTSGVVTWEVTGLIKRPIKSVGTFSLRRIFAAEEVE